MVCRLSPILLFPVAYRVGKEGATTISKKVTS